MPTISGAPETLRGLPREVLREVLRGVLSGNLESYAR